MSGSLDGTSIPTTITEAILKQRRSVEVTMGDDVAHEEEYQSEYHRLHCLDNVCPGLLRLGGGAVRKMEDPVNKRHLGNSH